jgi:hypothetical protein
MDDPIKIKKLPECSQISFNLFLNLSKQKEQWYLCNDPACCCPSAVLICQEDTLRIPSAHTSPGTRQPGNSGTAPAHPGMLCRVNTELTG